MRTVMVDRATRAVLLLDATTDTPCPRGVDCEQLLLSDPEAAKLGQPGSYTVDVNNVLTVTPPGPETPAVIENLAATGDFDTNYTLAMTRLTQIKNATSPTNAQTIAAIQDMATILQRLCRLAYARFGP